ncbi:hypothetical protein LSCM4_05236 [Leishmania orientalis]|uniref:Uncharacterized protein n=1 Tax=Leishmania orientalis TaxID=2249476 RepID=A0A836KJ80_9TRYP|nr:hypothetical protein LSCM4_05236 [Leishmania orientalis]
MLRRAQRLTFLCAASTRRSTHTSEIPDSAAVYHAQSDQVLVQSAEIVKETVHESKAEDALKNSTVDPEDVSVMNNRDNEYIELCKLRYMHSQDGPFIGSKMKDSTPDQVSFRKRRHIVRVPQPEMEYSPNETSFRRLPKNYIIPNEFELRALYPLSTSLKIIEGKADCADHSAFDIDADPSPIAYSMVAPPDWKPDIEYPYMVVLPDHRGIPRDFEDVCANFFERPVHYELMAQQRWVILSPVVNLRHNLQVPVEGVVARFCDWVKDNFRVENGKVHLFGKGNGGYVALRTVLEHKDLVLSVTAILGRNGSPFRPLDRAQDKVKNYNGVHSLVYVPGLLRKQDWYYKFKFMLDMARVRPPLRNVHFADVRDHQVYYAINPQEFWNYMAYFRKYNMKMITESGYSV